MRKIPHLSRTFCPCLPKFLFYAFRFFGFTDLLYFTDRESVFYVHKTRILCFSTSLLPEKRPGESCGHGLRGGRQGALRATCLYSSLPYPRPGTIAPAPDGKYVIRAAERPGTGAGRGTGTGTGFHFVAMHELVWELDSFSCIFRRK